MFLSLKDTQVLVSNRRSQKYSPLLLPYLREEMHVTWKLLQFKCKGEKEQRNEHPVLKVLVIISKYGENMGGRLPLQAFCITACKPNPL